jgi:hypothetical protein
LVKAPLIALVIAERERDGDHLCGRDESRATLEGKPIARLQVFYILEAPGFISRKRESGKTSFMEMKDNPTSVWITFAGEI